MEKGREVLEFFLNKSVTSSKGVMMEFAKLKGAIVHLPRKRGGFVYVPGTREDRVLLVARADTVWDSSYNMYMFPRQKIEFKDGFYFSPSRETGIGANNRAGCALLYLLRDTGHSLLVLDRQEYGFSLAVYELRVRYNELFREMNRHRYMMEFDCEGSDRLKYYDMPAPEEFRKFIEEGLGYHEVLCDKKFTTDICELSESICGVNISAGYYNQSTAREKLSYSQWLNTYTKVKDLLSGEQPHFEEYSLDEFSFDKESNEEI